jgi:ABC-type nitrate/sulfonate/bicarbonate transport system substrate-binding protein
VVIGRSLSLKFAAARSLDPVTFRLAWIPGFGGDQPPFFLRAVNGFYKEAGIDLKIIDGRGAASSATLLSQ